MDLADLVSARRAGGWRLGMWRTGLRRWWREPLLHFLVLGALLLMVQQRWAEDWRAYWNPERIEISVADQQRLSAAWQRETGRRPEARELQVLLRGWVDDELLFREAKRLGLHEQDPVIRQRLLDNMRFVEQQWDLEGDGATDRAKALIEAAERLGMIDRDLIIRGRLIQRMRYRIERGVRVTDGDVEAYLRDNADAIKSPLRLRFEQRYFGSGHAASAVAQWRERLEAGDPTVSGEPFLLGEHFDIHVDGVAQRFGAAVAEAVASAPLGEWVGPVASVYGWHLLRVESRQPGAVPYAEKRVALMLTAEREQAAVRDYLDDRRRRYRIEIEEPPA